MLTSGSCRRLAARHNQALDFLGIEMAFREIRIIFYSLEPGLAKQLNLSIGGPFEWYMDSVMRGRFKYYSGEEVKGINIVNLCCYDAEYIEAMIKNSGHGIREEWLNLLNTYEYELEMDFKIFSGTNEQNIIKSIEIFVQYASLLNVPAMNALVQHTKESIGINSIEKAIEKSEKELEKIMQYVSNKI